jgi:signal transduction histidine kinase
MSHESADLAQRLLDRIERIAHVGHWSLNCRTKELFWSDEVYRIHGRDPAHFSPDLKTGIEAYHPDDRSAVEQHVQEAMQNKQGFEFQKRIVKPSGEIRHVVSQGECETDDDGNLTLLFGVLKDITDVVSERERFELAALASNSAVWDWDVRNDIIYWAGRSAEVLGFESNDALPRTTESFFDAIIHPEDRKMFKDAVLDYFKNHDSFSYEVRTLNRHQDTRWFLARGQAQWDDGNLAMRMSGSFTDIDRLKTITENIKKKNEELDQFATIAAHDLQEPLRSISGFLEILKLEQGGKLDDEAIKYIDLSVQGCENLSELIKNILDYSRVGIESLVFKPDNLDKTVKSLVRNMRIPITEAEATVTIENLPEISCDINLVKQVFYNLIENALKYRNEKAPEVTVSSEEHEEEWLFSVKDNGIGIDPKHLSNIFDMFRRLHKKQDYSGTGVGLAFCKKIVELHNGRIWAASEPGTGTTFFFTIPKKIRQT